MNPGSFHTFADLFLALKLAPPSVGTHLITSAKCFCFKTQHTRLLYFSQTGLWVRRRKIISNCSSPGGLISYKFKQNDVDKLQFTMLYLFILSFRRIFRLQKGLETAIYVVSLGAEQC